MTPETAKPAVVRLERTIPAPPHRVYRAWLDPEVLCRWMAPGRRTVTRAEVDEREGGSHRIWHGDGGGFDSQLLALDPGERIVFLWGFVGPDRISDIGLASRLTIELRDAPGGATALTLVHDRLEAIDAAMPGMARSTAAGWAMALDKLAATL